MTRTFIVDRRDVERGVCCVDCGQPFAEGEAYTRVHGYLVTCLSCAAKVLVRG